MFHRVKPEGESQSENQQEQQDETAAREAQESPQSQQKPAPAPVEEAEADVPDQFEEPQQEDEDMTQQDQTAEQATETEAPEERTQDTAAAHDVPSNPYQRQGPAPVQPAAVGGFVGQPYGAAPYGAHQHVTAPETVQEQDPRRLTIGEGITMSGEIEACDYLTIEGTVEAALKGAKVLEVAESGTFYGAVEIEEATIAGRFEGDIIVKGRLTILSTGTITGSIAYSELEVESGAVIDGKITPIGALSDAARKPSKAMKAKAGKAIAKEAANNDGQLFQEQAAAE